MDQHCKVHNDVLKYWSANLLPKVKKLVRGRVKTYLFGLQIQVVSDYLYAIPLIIMKVS